MKGNGDLPGKLSRGQRLTAEWLNRLLDAVRSRTITAGPGLRATHTTAGTTVSVDCIRRDKMQESGAMCVIGEVTANVTDFTATGRVPVRVSGKDCIAYYVASSGYTSLKAGDLVLLHPCQFEVAFGEEEDV